MGALMQKFYFTLFGQEVCVEIDVTCRNKATQGLIESMLQKKLEWMSDDKRVETREERDMKELENDLAFEESARLSLVR